MKAKMAVLITGAGSGFGLLTSKALLDRGHTVLATMREPEGRHRDTAGELRSHAEGAPGGVEILELDVTSDDSVDAAVTRGLERVGRIDVAVNNAGVSMSGFAEAFTADEMARLMDINVLGAQRVNRALLPSMRAARSGLLVHVTSTFGRFVVPFVAPYTVTKWALEALAESYHLELQDTGVEVAIVEPGAFDTGHAERIQRPADTEREASYGARAEVPGRMWPGFVEKMAAAQPNPGDVSEAVVELIESPAGSRPLRLVVDRVTGGDVVEEMNRSAAELEKRYLCEIGVAAALGLDDKLPST